MVRMITDTNALCPGMSFFDRAQPPSVLSVMLRIAPVSVTLSETRKERVTS